jgi:hypothetical protein
MADSDIGMIDAIFNKQYAEEKVRKQLEKEKAEAEKKKKLEEEKQKKNVQSIDHKEAFKFFDSIATTINNLNKDNSNKKPLPYLVLNASNNDTSKTDEEPKNESKDSNASRNNHMPIPDMQTDESSSDEKNSSGTKSSTPNVGNSTPKPTSGGTSPRRNTSRGEYADLENSGKTKEWYESLANSSYANDKEHEADMKAYREIQAKELADNDYKSKAWYESLANSSYANDKKYEADMKAYNKMKSDEIAKNGYYTDSQGVKVYAKAMTDKPKKENNNE